METEMQKQLFACETSKNWLTGVLREGKVDITFTKKDGTSREMKCTLNEKIIGTENAPKGTGRTKPTESLAVFDIEKNAWRSFRWDSITQVRFTLGEEE